MPSSAIQGIGPRASPKSRSLPPPPFRVSFAVPAAQVVHEGIACQAVGMVRAEHIADPGVEVSVRIPCGARLRSEVQNNGSGGGRVAGRITACAARQAVSAPAPPVRMSLLSAAIPACHCPPRQRACHCPPSPKRRSLLAPPLRLSVPSPPRRVSLPPSPLSVVGLVHSR